MSRYFILKSVEQAQGFVPVLLGMEYPVQVVVMEGDKRSLDQNDKLHAMCTDVAKQKEWAGKKRDVEFWKRLFVAAVYGQEVVPSLDGTGFVALDKKTSKMSKKKLSEVIESIYAWGAENSVHWTQE